MIPNAWYSFTALRLIRPSNPCCIPRRKRTMATLGEGYMQICISVSRDLYYKTTDQLNVDGDLARANPGKNNPGGHAHDIPEVLLANEMPAVWNPLPVLSVVDIAHDREGPCGTR